MPAGLQHESSRGLDRSPTKEMFEDYVRRAFQEELLIGLVRMVLSPSKELLKDGVLLDIGLVRMVLSPSKELLKGVLVGSLEETQGGQSHQRLIAALFHQP